MNENEAIENDQLAHLPDRKRRELQRAAQILFDEFEDAVKTKLSDKSKRGRILKLILFGSYGRPFFVDIARDVSCSTKPQASPSPPLRTLRQRKLVQKHNGISISGFRAPATA